MKDLNQYQRILDDRTKRAELIQRYAKEFLFSVIEVSLNIPGIKKDTLRFRAVHLHLLSKVLNTMDARLVYLEFQAAGPFALLLSDTAPEKLKSLSIDLETETPLGRLYDIDIFSTSGVKISRDNGLRRCIMCDEAAFICARRRSHSLSEISSAIEELIVHNVSFQNISLCESFLEIHQREHPSSTVCCIPTFRRGLAGVIGRYAQLALLSEVMVTPKPGLVDREGSGAHSDMDLHSFIASASVLGDVFAEMVQIGMDHEADSVAQDMLPALRQVGISGEERMMRATAQVNTHKGSIFSLGLMCGAVGYSLMHTCSDSLTTIISKICEGLVKHDMSMMDRSTYGKRLYLDHGISGARGEAEQGFPAVIRTRDRIKLLYELEGSVFYHNLNSASLQALVENIASFDDTNIAGRGGMHMLGNAKKMAQTYLDNGGVASDKDLTSLRGIGNQFKSWNISPGGSADTLAGSLFLLGISTLLESSNRNVFLPFGVSSDTRSFS